MSLKNFINQDLSIIIDGVIQISNGEYHIKWYGTQMKLSHSNAAVTIQDDELRYTYTDNRTYYHRLDFERKQYNGAWTNLIFSEPSYPNSDYAYSVTDTSTGIHGIVCIAGTVNEDCEMFELGPSVNSEIPYGRAHEWYRLNGKL